MAYQYLPLLWQSNLVSVPKLLRVSGVGRHRMANRRTGYTREAGRDRLEQGPPGQLPLAGRWVPFEAIATYQNDNPDDGYLLIPVLWRGSFQKPKDIAWVREGTCSRRWWRMSGGSKLPTGTRSLGQYYPGMVIFCPDPVAAAVVQRNWIENLDESGCCGQRPPSVVAQGQVVRPMNPPGFHGGRTTTCLSWRRIPWEISSEIRSFPGQWRLRHRQRDAGIPGIPGHLTALPG